MYREKETRKGTTRRLLITMPALPSPISHEYDYRVPKKFRRIICEKSLPVCSITNMLPYGVHSKKTFITRADFLLIVPNPLKNKKKSIGSRDHLFYYSRVSSFFVAFCSDVSRSWNSPFVCVKFT